MKIIPCISIFLIRYSASVLVVLTIWLVLIGGVTVSRNKISKRLIAHMASDIGTHNLHLKAFEIPTFFHRHSDKIGLDLLPEITSDNG